MPFIQMPMNEAHESEAVPEGMYDLRIHSAEVKDSESSGKPMVECLMVIEATEFPHAAPITFYLPLIHPDDKPSARNFKLVQAARLCTAFGVPFEDNGFDTDDLVGATANVLLKQETVDKDRDGNPRPDPFTRNVIALPRLPSEEQEGSSEGTPTRRTESRATGQRRRRA
jgi:hypothetical protein